MSAAERKIQAELLKPTRFEFSDTPLIEVVQFLEDAHGIEIEFDHKALDDIGLDHTSTLVTRDLSSVSLRSALRLILRELGLTYVIRDEVLMITNKEEEENILGTRVYPSDLAPAQLEKLTTIIQQTIAPNAWKDNGGPGCIAAYQGGIVILQAESVHEQINDLLDQLRRLK
jgi:hypothetical protein